MTNVNENLNLKVEIDWDELAKLNAKRKSLGLQAYTPFDYIDNTVCDALNSKIIVSREVKPLAEKEAT